MNILLTNDDGYNSKGIVLLEKKLQKYGNIFVCAPYEHMSAKSCSITIYEPIHIKVEDRQKISIDGSPADCVSFGLHYFNVKFDLVISGCNNGYNISYDTMYSGTIGACLQSLIHRIPAIAISCPFNFELVDKYLDEVLHFIFLNKLISNRYLLNVNFPAGDVVKDIKIGKLFIRNDHRYYLKKDDEYHTQRDTQKEFMQKNTDCYQVNNHIVSIVPLSFTYFKTNQYNYLLKKVRNNNEK